MVIIKLTDTKETLDDIERICQHLLDHEELLPMMTEDEIEDISYILKPTLEPDQNEDEKRSHWRKLLKEFTVTDTNGDTLRFIRDEETQALYFGSKKGFDTLEDINK